MICAHQHLPCIRSSQNIGLFCTHKTSHSNHANDVTVSFSHAHQLQTSGHQHDKYTHVYDKDAHDRTQGPQPHTCMYTSRCKQVHQHDGDVAYAARLMDQMSTDRPRTDRRTRTVKLHCKRETAVFVIELGRIFSYFVRRHTSRALRDIFRLGEY
jgi:hypothetical protein